MGGMESYVIESYFFIDSPKFASSLGFVQFSKQCLLALSNLRTPQKIIGICSERSPFPRILCFLGASVHSHDGTSSITSKALSIKHFQCTSFKKLLPPTTTPFQQESLYITKQPMHYCGNPSKITIIS